MPSVFSANGFSISAVTGSVIVSAVTGVFAVTGAPMISAVTGEIAARGEMSCPQLAHARTWLRPNEVNIVASVRN